MDFFQAAGLFMAGVFTGGALGLWRKERERQIAYNIGLDIGRLQRALEDEEEARQESPAATYGIHAPAGVRGLWNEDGSNGS